MQFAASQRNLDEEFLKVKPLETEFEEVLNVVFERTTDGSVMMVKQFETEVARDLEKIFEYIKYEVAKIATGLKTS